jgi:hypothetical protein
MTAFGRAVHGRNIGATLLVDALRHRSRGAFQRPLTLKANAKQVVTSGAETSATRRSAGRNGLWSVIMGGACARFTRRELDDSAPISAGAAVTSLRISSDSAPRLWPGNGCLGRGHACAAITARGRRTSRLQSTTAPAVRLISVAVMVRAQSEAAKTAMLATSS